ncbi:hypothetical protein DMA11_17260 [Marinilabiliaceae bacterium JC017]|nr:hypothetical protein DMA11_17260 [Marinilabiliaceae bacterium JC017]
MEILSVYVSSQRVMVHSVNGMAFFKEDWMTHDKVKPITSNNNTSTDSSGKDPKGKRDFNME